MKRKLKIVLTFIFLMLTYNVVSNAAISATNKTVNSGESFSVSVTSNVSLSAYTVRTTSYNGLTFVTSSGGTGAGSTTISDAKASGGMTNLATFQFKAPEVENDQTFQIGFSASGMGDVDLNKVADSSCSATITVKAKKQTSEGSNAAKNEETTSQQQTQQSQNQTKSNVATLSNLGIKGQYDFTGFTPSKTSYSVTVPNDAESVEIYASKGQSGQKITGTGTKQLQEGANTVNVVVTAEDGKITKTYTINIERKTSEGKEETDEPTDQEADNTQEITFGLKKLEIEGMEFQPEFQTDIYEYTLELSEDKSNLGLITEATDEKSSIEVSGNENLQDGENVITILVKDETGEKTATYQITVNKKLGSKIQPRTTNDISQKKLILLGAGAIAILLMIIIIVALIKKKKNSSNVSYYKEEIETQNNYDDEMQYTTPKKRKHSKGKRYK